MSYRLINLSIERKFYEIIDCLEKNMLIFSKNKLLIKIVY